MIVGADAVFDGKACRLGQFGGRGDADADDNKVGRNLASVGKARAGDHGFAQKPLKPGAFDDLDPVRLMG